MKKQTNDDIITLFCAIYKIPGQYFIGGLILLYVWKTMRDWNPYAWLLILPAIIFFVLEVISVFTAGRRVFLKIKEFFEDLF